MAKKPTNLTAHRNTLYKRKRKEKRDDLMHDIKRGFSEIDVRAYALVTIDSEGMARCYWDTGSIMPMWGFPGTVEAVIRRDIEESDVDETWKPKPNQF